MFNLRKFVTLATNSPLRSSAVIVGGDLVLTFPEALSPVIWRMDIDRMRSSVIEILPQADTADVLLTVKTTSGESFDIARFADKTKALEAFAQISKAMREPQVMGSAIGVDSGLSVPPSLPTHPAYSSSSFSGFVKWGIALLGVVLVVYLFSYIGSLAPRFEEGGSVTVGQSAEDDQSGVPLSAESYLKGF